MIHPIKYLLYLGAFSTLSVLCAVPQALTPVPHKQTPPKDAKQPNADDKKSPGNTATQVKTDKKTSATAVVPPQTQQPAPKKEEKPIKHFFWGQGKFYHSSRNEPLQSLIKEFCGIQKVSVVVSPKIVSANIAVNRDFGDMYPVQFWEEITQIYGLIWFYDGSVLYVYNGDEAETRVVKVSSAKVDRLMGIIEGFNFHSSSLSLKCVKEAGVIFASGVPKFLSIIQELETKINETVAINSDFEVRSFPIKHAWAGDVKFGNSTVPGVVTLLQNALGIQGKSFTNDANPAKEVRVAPMQGVLTPQTPVPPTTAANMNVEDSQKNGAIEKKGGASMGIQGETITADMRCNAVIVRALKENLQKYGKLISELDKAVSLVEIHAAIVDFQNNAGLNIGTNYMTLNRNDQKIDLKVSPLGNGTEGASETGWSASGGVKGIVNGYDFLGKIKLLESKGLAHILSRPTITTLDNIEAIIQNNETYYIPVSGRSSNDLYPVSAGMTLKVTPHVIIDEDNQRGKIELLLYIEDGSATQSATASAPPTITTIKITTQAMVFQNQSLLVGGYFKEDHNHKDQGVPGLRNIPLFGSLLFGNRSKTNTMRQRFFLITPKIVHLSADKDAKYQEYFNDPNEVDKSVLNHMTKQ